VSFGIPFIPSRSSTARQGTSQLLYTFQLKQQSFHCITLIRTPSPYPQDSSDYKGPILFNPGGPGGSGVHFILTSAPKFRVILGDAFDLVGFDPRDELHQIPLFSPKY
jgi:pimeloyl-ACP methyl ester carboxylesterase